MSMQRKMRWGHDFPKDKGEEMLTLNQFGKTHVSWGNPIKTVNYPFSCLSSQPFIFARMWLRQLLQGKGRVWENSNWVEHPVSNVVFCLHGKENTRIVSPFHSRIMFSFWIHIQGEARRLAHRSLFSIHVEARGQLSSSSVYPSRFESVFYWRDCGCCVAVLS